MLYYKMQLLNREKVYNEIFNANPNVGVLNPLEGKNKKWNTFIYFYSNNIVH